jgi:actin cytoskeleton-regulatory complex protein SLA1
VRTWTDRSKSFSVEAQFLALKDGKINLHKMNGVKIAVPVGKMSVEDLEYVERITGVSLDEDKPLSTIKGQRSRSAPSQDQPSGSTPTVGATIEQPKKPEYDWFQFFLSCDVAVGLCERYAQTFQKDSMDESVLPDVDATVLRTLGLREGDIIKVMRYLDNKYGRNNKRNASFGDGDGDGEGGGGLFSGPGGALKNNTRKGRPAPTVQTNDVVDPKAFSQQDATDKPLKTANDRVATPIASAPTPVKKDATAGFDDDAWDVKPTKQQPHPAPSEAPQQSSTRPQAQLPALTGSLQELSLLTAPLEPTKMQNTAPTQQIQVGQPVQIAQSQQQAHPQQTPQPPGVTPSFFAGINQQPNNFQQPPTTGPFLANSQFGSQQPTYIPQQPPQQNIARQRPIAPQFTQNQGSLMPPPPPRPLSAPQTAQQSAFGPPPLQPQMTGLPNSSGFQGAPLAPPGQSLAEMNQMKMQQQYAQQQQMQPQMTGFGGQMNNMMLQPTSFGQFNGMNQQANGFGQQMQPQQTGFQPTQAFMNGQISGSPFADPRAQQFSPVQQQPTGFQGSFNPTQYPQPTGINSYLPPALQPQQTAAIQSQPQQTNINGFSQNFGQQPPLPPVPQQPTIAPLLPQKTGPPPPVRFGVTGDTKKLMPQATGRRANLAAASEWSIIEHYVLLILTQPAPQNPFGFD